MTFVASLRSRFQRRRSYFLRRDAVAIPRLETLEDRTVPVAIRWTNPASGSWHLASNWSPAQVPGPADDVTISVAAAITVTHNAGTTAVRSIDNQETLSVTGGSSLTVATQLRSGSGSSINSNAGTFVADGAPDSTNIDGASFNVINGIIRLPAARRYDALGSGSQRMTVTGAGSVLDLSNVTVWRGSVDNGNVLYLQALGGGVIDLRRLPEIVFGDTRFTARGPDSRINLSALTRFSGRRGDGNWNWFEAAQQGNIQVTASPQGLTFLNNVELYLDGTSTLALSQIQTYTGGTAYLRGLTTYAFTSLTNAQGSGFVIDRAQVNLAAVTNLSLGAVTLTGGGRATLTNASNIDGASFNISGGVTLALPAATRYDALGSGSRRMTVTGTGSVLDLSNVTVWRGSVDNGNVLYLQALGGGVIDLQRLPEIDFGDTRFSARGPDSRINLAALTSFAGRRGENYNWLEADQTGTMDLSPSGTYLANVFLYLAGTITGGTIELANGSSIRTGGTLPDGLRVSGGSVSITSTVDTLTVPGAYDHLSGSLTGAGTLSVGGHLTWSSGTMSGIGTSARTVATGGVSIAGDGNKVLDGRSLFNLGNGTWTGLGDLLFSNNAVFLNAEDATFDMQSDARILGVGTVRNAGTLLKTDGIGFETQIGVPLQNTGTIQVDAGTLLLNHAAGFTNAGTVNIRAGTVLGAAASYTQLEGSTNLLGGTLAAPTVALRGGLLTGAGFIAGNLTNEARITIGGAGTVGTLAITGDYVQTADGILEMELLSATEFDKLTVAGSATVDGRLSVTLLDGFTSAVDEAFELLTADAGLTGTFAALDLPDLGEEMFLDPQYGENSFTLRTTTRS